MPKPKRAAHRNKTLHQMMRGRRSAKHTPKAHKRQPSKARRYLSGEEQ